MADKLRSIEMDCHKNFATIYVQYILQSVNHAVSYRMS